MSRVLKVPPVVSQRGALLPDGSVDPAGETDCGEACMSSGVDGINGLYISPGCIRQALGKSSASGNSTAANLSWYAGRIGRVSSQQSWGSGVQWEGLSKLRHHGRYVLILGTWVLPGYEHWVLAYERKAASVLVMDPWSGAYQEYGRQFLNEQSAWSQVTLA